MCDIPEQSLERPDVMVQEQERKRADKRGQEKAQHKRLVGEFGKTGEHRICAQPFLDVGGAGTLSDT
ncbi:hypothetical protein [Ralstonia syzygii]|uniref:hypothetical protein n=1 Tax=Ralstonia syzygii TaxID=28097 RepID=UPI0018D19ED5|nr:hypothetical protein [Ralstonia syzygii]